MTLAARVVYVTGGSKGIGAGCAQAFCQAGWHVVISDIDQVAGLAFAQELSDQGPGTCQFVLCDVRQLDLLKQSIDATAERYGRLDCLINNAGWHPPHQPIDEFSIESFRALLELNLVAVFAGCKFALPHLRAAQGSIINLSSLVALIGQEHATTYCATKGGVSALTKALAIDEARHGVRVNAVLPGSIVTPMRVAAVAQAPNPQSLDSLLDSYQWPGRSGRIDEVGQACLFLAGLGAGFITGIELVISGGAELGYGIKVPELVGLHPTS